MTISEKLELYKRFNEGCEIEDAVKLLIKAAYILNGISADHELSLTILVIEKLIREYMVLAINRELDWEEYAEIDSELYSYMLGGAIKLTEEKYLNLLKKNI